MINKVILEGRLARDIEVKKTQNDLSVAQFTLAVNRKSTKEAEADFINCVAWRQSADFLGQYASKGDLVSVVGHIATRTFEGRNGKVYVTEVICEDVNLIARKQASNEPRNDFKPKDDFKPQSMTEYTGKEKNETLNFEPDDLPFF